MTSLCHCFSLSLPWREPPHGDNDEKDNPQRPSWKQLLSSHGAELWRIRKEVLRNNAGPCTCVALPLDTQNTQQVNVMACPKYFQAMEVEHGLDKFDTTGQPPRPLTRCTGEEWTRQRSQVKSALTGVPQRSLEAAKVVDIRMLLQKHSQSGGKRVDLKQVAIDAAVTWVVSLFQGCRDVYAEQACFRYWEVIRSIQTIPMEEICQKRKTLVQSFRFHQGGLLQLLHESGLSPSEASDNGLNAMIAALDAVQVLIFWTLWNLSRTKDGFQKCQSELGDENHQEDLKKLADIKREATLGQPIDYNGLSFLGRSLMETLRVFPPVWTLPRTWPVDDTAVSSKLDVPSVNGALQPSDWDPNVADRKCLLASFGLGRRHCPAGTAALYAAYRILLQFLTVTAQFTECTPDRALENAYLVPTLGVQGPQYFHVEWSPHK